MLNAVNATIDVARTPNPHVGFGIGPHFCLGANLAKLEIRTVRDLLFHVPRSYRDRRQVTPIAFLQPNTEATVLARVVSIRVERRFRGRRDVTAMIQDDTGSRRVVWFNQPYVEKALEVGRSYTFSGPVEPFHGLELHNPEFEPETGGDDVPKLARVTPVYGLTQGVAQRWRGLEAARKRFYQRIHCAGVAGLELRACARQQ